MKREREEYEDFELNGRIQDHRYGPPANMEGNATSPRRRGTNTYVAPPYIHIGGLKPVVRRRLTTVRCNQNTLPVLL